jgi:hypothetical protein
MSELHFNIHIYVSKSMQYSKESYRMEFSLYFVTYALPYDTFLSTEA